MVVCGMKCTERGSDHSMPFLSQATLVSATHRLAPAFGRMGITLLHSASNATPGIRIRSRSGELASMTAGQQTVPPDSFPAEDEERLTIFPLAFHISPLGARIQDTPLVQRTSFHILQGVQPKHVHCRCTLRRAGSCWREVRNVQLLIYLVSNRESSVEAAKGTHSASGIQLRYHPSLARPCPWTDNIPHLLLSGRKAAVADYVSQLALHISMVFLPGIE